MAYRKPGVTVTQEFANIVPALAAFALPSVAVGPAYQLVDNDLLGTYSGSTQAYAYAGLMGGAAVDLEEMPEDEAFPITKKPVSVKLVNAEVEILPEQTDGSVVGDVLTDLTAGQFDDVAAGDIVVMVEALALTILAAQTNGVTTNTTGQRNRLTAGTLGQFANVKVGDSVIVTAGTNTTTGTYAVTAKLSNDLLLLDANVNDGVGPSTNVAYSITGDRGTVNQGEYKVKTKTDANNLVLESPVADTPESPITYFIKRQFAEIVLPRVDTLSSSGFVAAAASVSLPGSGVLEYEIDTIMFPIIAGDVYASYRALRTDLAAEVKEFTGVSSINAIFGTDQIAPANPLAYALSLMLQNTVTAVHGLGLDDTAVTDEVLSYTAATEALKASEMYAIAVLSQNPVVHTLMKNHVEQLSLPNAKLERVVLFNSALHTTAVMSEEATTSISLTGARVVVNTQVDGSGAIGTPAQLTDLTTDQFLNVGPGDSVVVQSGTGVTPGTYLVASKTDNNNITLDSNFIVSGTPTDIQYYIVRRDGLGADGMTFYDRNATFISDGVAAGHYLNILTGTYKGRWKIATVSSEKQVVLTAAIAGVAAVVAPLTYQMDRDMQKSEQASLVKGYSESFASRRCVHVWPDVLKAPVGQTIENLPGIYGPVVIAALTTGLPTQQGFTNLAVSGFLGLDHSSRYFTEDQLNTIADGGTMILAQDGPDQPLYVRHQLTTDRSAIKFQEFSFTKNCDFVAKFLRNTYAPFIGQYNIIDTTLDALKQTGAAAIAFLRDKTRVPRFGGVIRGGSLDKVAEDTTQIDTVLITFSLNLPIPLNNIDITVQV